MKLNKKHIFIFSILFLTLICLLIFNGLSKNNNKNNPNVVLILIDALRADHLGCYGYKLETSPNIDKFASKNILFKHMFAQAPSTKPSVASLFSSLYPSQHNSIFNDDRLSDKIVTLAEILKSNGYHTYAVNSNSVIKKKFNYNQGFDKWEDLIDGDASVLNDFLFTKLNKYKNPFFLYLHYLDPHSPYTAPEPYYKFFNKDYNGRVSGSGIHTIDYFKKNPSELQQLELFYDNEIRFVDTQIGVLFDTLNKMDLYNNSIIIIMSDHGEMFLEHGSLRHSNGLYSELIDVPLIMKIPDSEKYHHVMNNYVQTIDILPAILDLLNIKYKHRLMGESVFSLPSRNRPVFSEHLRLLKDYQKKISINHKPVFFIWQNPQLSLIIDNLKLIKNLENGDYYLFDLEKDPEEKKNILKINPQSTDMIKKMNFLMDHINKTSKVKQQAVDIDEKTLEQLRGLGYVK